MKLIKSFVPHSRCFGSYFDVIFLMYLVSSGFSFKPTSSSSSSSSTQFSQEWARRKVVIKHSIKSNPPWVWGGGDHNLRPGCRRRLLGHFTPPLGTLGLDAPALFRVRSPNDGNTLGLSHLPTLPVLRVLFFYVIFLMYLVSSGFPFKPTSSSSSTEFSQEWVCREMVVKHSINQIKFTTALNH